MSTPDDASTEVLPAAQPAQASREPLELIGRTLGKFAILERLGKGGSGEVFRAEQAQLGRSAVVKVLRREVAATPNRIERFLREARLASRLDHPYAAHVYAFGAEPDGVLWIAMEHVRGPTLDELIATRGSIPAGVFGPLFVRLCEVVHTAHELGIVHRDIKGSNVMVIERAGQLLPKLLDFGIAKTADDATSTSPGVADEPLTEHGVTLGSPHYMAPEQWQRPADVDGRADVYALGVLAYRCLAGRLPFQHIARAQLGDAHLYTTPAALPANVPSALAIAIDRALAKRPDARWQTAIELGEAIQRTLGTALAEAVPIFDAPTRTTWLAAGPQPIADAIAQLASLTTTVEVDAALREVVAIACRWVAVLALSSMGAVGDPRVRDHARGVIGRDDAAPWLRLARAAASAAGTAKRTAFQDVLLETLGRTDALAALADRLDDRVRARGAAALAADVEALADALRPLEPLLAYALVVGRGDGSAELWQGPRRRERERRVVWGEPLGDREVALLDDTGAVALRLSPLAQVIAPLPAAEPELFLLWRGGRGPARLVAAPWGFERDDEAAGDRLHALSTEDSDTAADPAGDRSPYPGLAAYGVADAEHFVGREREIETLANRLVRAPLLAVLGPSGVGKSSFIHAGLIPRLGEHHRILTMRPGRHPMSALAQLPEVSCDPDDVAALIARLRELGDSAQRGLVLAVDQLEELVTLCGDADERRRFAEVLAGAADGPRAPVRVVATLRDDFATVIESEDALRGRFEVFVLATPPPEALRRIVIEPARRNAVAIDARVVEDMVAEVAGRPASLPLLSFTASLLWQARDRKTHQITDDAYRELGGVAGALATYADQVYASLARRDQDTVRDLFARLVAADGTRIPSPRAELEQLAGARGVLAHLIDARLLVVGEDDLVEIVHECLADRWPRLARWRSEDAADRALVGDVRVAARRWLDAERRPDRLWRGQALAELRRLAARSTVLTADERAFADASAGAQRRARRIRRGLVAGVMIALAGVAAVMAYLSIAANDSRNAAEASATLAQRSAKLAEDRLTASLIAQGRRELNDGRALPALAYFGEAFRRGADSVALREMETIASRAWRFERLVVRPGSFTTLAAQGDTLIAGDQSGTLHWYVAGKPTVVVATDLGSIINIKPRGDRLIVSGQRAIGILDASRRIASRIVPHSAAFASDVGPGADEITALERDELAIYAFDGTRRRELALHPAETGFAPVFDRAGRFALIGGQGELSLIDRVAMTRTTLDSGGYSTAVGSDDGELVAYLDKDRVIHILSAAGLTARTIRTRNEPLGLIVSPSGDRLAAFGARSIVVYDSATGAALRELPVEGEAITYELRGDDLWLGGDNGAIRHYHGSDLVASLPSMPGQIMELHVSGETLGVIGNDSSLVLLDANAAQLVIDARPCPHATPTASGIGMIAMCTDGRDLAFVGRRALGEISDMSASFFAEDLGSGRAAVSGESITVFDRANHLLVHSAPTDPRGALAFVDPDHLLVLEPPSGKGLFRWQLSTNRWEHLADVSDAATVAVASGGGFIGHIDGAVSILSLDDGRERRRVQLGNRVEFLTASADGRWVVAQLGNGGTSVLDGETGEVARTLATADSIGAASVLDPSGELVLRPSRGTFTIWERATGDELIWSLDLIRPAVVARMTKAGQIEVGGYVTGLVDLPRDARPVARIIHDIDCRIPFRVVGSRLEPAAAAGGCGT